VDSTGRCVALDVCDSSYNWCDIACINTPGAVGHASQAMNQKSWVGYQCVRELTGFVIPGGKIIENTTWHYTSPLNGQPLMINGSIWSMPVTGTNILVYGETNNPSTDGIICWTPDDIGSGPATHDWTNTGNCQQPYYALTQTVSLSSPRQIIESFTWISLR
jgi:hypothetical protein